MPTYRVTYDVIVEADTEDEAVREANGLMQDPAFEPTITVVTEDN